MSERKNPYGEERINDRRFCFATRTNAVFSISRTRNSNTLSSGHDKIYFRIVDTSRASFYSFFPDSKFLKSFLGENEGFGPINGYGFRQTDQLRDCSSPCYRR